MHSSNTNKFVTHSLELRSLRSWFKNLPSIYKVPNALNDSKCFTYPSGKDQFNIKGGIRKDYIDQPFISFYNRFILRNVFESWKTYVIYKLRKRKALCEADHVYRKNLKRNILNVLSKNILKSDKFYKFVIKRRYFELWKRYIKIVEINKSLIERSKTFYIRTSLQKSITIWKSFVQHKKEKYILERKSTEKVSKLYNLNLLHKYFMAWISVHNSIKVFKEQLQMVLYHNNKKMLHKYFMAWISVHNSIKVFKEQLQMVLYHNNKKMLHKYFFAWIVYCNMEKQKKDMQDRADQQYCQRLMKKCLTRFILYMDEVYVYKKKLKMAYTFYESNITVKAFKAWIQWYYRVKRIHNIMVKVREIAEDKLKRKIILHWKLYIRHKKHIRRQMSLCLTKYSKKISINAFIKLQNYVLYKKRKRIYILDLSNKTIAINTKIQNMYIDKWKKALNVHMQEKCKIFRAIEFYNNYISKKCLFLWKIFSQQYKIKLLHKQELNKRASCFILNECIRLWKLKYEETCKIYEKEKLLVSVMQGKIQKKYFMFWKIYRNQKIKKRKDIEHAKDMNKKFFLQEGLREILRHSLFTTQFDHENKLKFAISKSVEDFEILSQYFTRWLSIIYLKEKSESLPLEKISYCSHTRDIIPCQYTVPKFDELNTLFINDTNNNSYFAFLCNDESVSSLTNNVELLPPSAFY